MTYPVFSMNRRRTDDTVWAYQSAADMNVNHARRWHCRIGRIVLKRRAFA